MIMASSSSSLLIPDRYYGILPCGAHLFPWLGIILSLLAALSSTLKRSIDYLEGDESLSFALLEDSINNTDSDEGMALDSSHPYPYRWMVASYVNPWSYLDEGVALNPDDGTPWYPYPFDSTKDAHMRQSQRLLIAAVVLALLGAVGTIHAWCWFEENGRGRAPPWHSSLVGCMTLALMAVTSPVNQIPARLLIRSETLCLDECQATFVHQDNNNLRVQPHCSWAFGAYASSLSSLCWLLLMIVLVVASLHHETTMANYHAAPSSSSSALHDESFAAAGVIGDAPVVGLELVTAKKVGPRRGEKGDEEACATDDEEEDVQSLS